MSDFKQTTDSILMIRPASCGYNPQTAASNSFQKQIEIFSAAEIQRRALKEFDDMVGTLRSENINVFVVEDTPEPPKPDAVFPNNWISFHPDGTVFLYPMLSEKRNTERRADIVETLRNNFRIGKIVDLSAGETGVLEGTGSMVFDHTNKIVYACLSPRTDAELLEKFASAINYRPLTFTASDENGAAIYHTNVVMCVGEKFAVVCAEAIENAAEKNSAVETLRETGHETIEISRGQMNCFAGNMLEVRGGENGNFVVMSKTARDSLNDSQIEKLEKHARILSADIPTIEAVGGGSVRCMLAEIFTKPAR